MQKIYILGTRGIPASHGGFETFAEKLSLYLVDKGWQVFVYCQLKGEGTLTYSQWNGVNLINIPVVGDGAKSTVIFDWKATLHALKQDGLFLTLGYNTAVFNILQRIKGQINVMNMDGIEWRRSKWGVLAKTWFWINERAGCWFANHLVADHPRIKDHLTTRVRNEKITMIPYGGLEVSSADSSVLSRFGVRTAEYSIVIARPEPENSFLEMVRAFSSKRRDHKLIVLGKFRPDEVSYHREVLESASDEVIFPGAIYDSNVVSALRYYSRFYLHGHQVGGTNPSLVEAMAAGCAVIAHDNQFNRWVVGDGACYFTGEQHLGELFDTLIHDNVKLQILKESSKLRYSECFTWEKVLTDYETLLLKFVK